MTAEETQQKRALRAELRARRRTMTAPESAAATEAISGRLIELAETLNANSLAAYLPAQDEPNIRPFLDWCAEQDVRVLLPVSRDDGLLDWVVTVEGEVEGALGVPEPVGELLGPIAINDVNLIVVPAAAVDRTGMRMGWGRGYFDRTLGSMEERPPVYAVVFDNELLDRVPTELHDKEVDGVITPSATVAFPERPL